MSDIVNGASGQTVIVLDSHSGFNEVKHLYGALTEVLAGADKIVLDASKVETVDTSMLQLLSVFASAVHQANRELSWVAPSKVVRESAKLLGLETHLVLPTV